MAGFVSGALVGVITMPIVSRFSDPRIGYMASTAVVSVICVVTDCSLPTGQGKRIISVQSILIMLRSVIFIPFMPMVLRRLGKAKSLMVGIVGGLLGLVGYVGAQEVTQPAIDLAVLLLKVYPITPAYAKEMRITLKERRESQNKV